LTSDVSGASLYLNLRWEQPVARPPLDLLQGTLDLLLLQTLSWGPAHGYAIARWIERLTGAVLQIGEGSLYPALHRLEEREWIEAEWRVSENNRKAKFYRLTGKGRQQLRTETASWTHFVEAIGKVLGTTQQPG
jgi:PadR family transcriptional regulator PadR